MALGAMCVVGDVSALLLPLSLPLPLPLPLKLAGARLLVGCFAAADVLLTSWILDSVGAARGGGGEQAHRTVSVMGAVRALAAVIAIPLVRACGDSWSACSLAGAGASALAALLFLAASRDTPVTPTPAVGEARVGGVA